MSSGAEWPAVPNPNPLGEGVYNAPELEAERFALPGTPEYVERERERRTAGIEAATFRPQQDYEAEAAQQRAKAEAFLDLAQGSFKPLRDAFSGQMHALCTTPAKHEKGGVLAGVPDLSQDPEAWGTYVKEKCRYATWEDKASGRKYGVAGALGDEGLVLVGMLVERKVPGKLYPHHTWMQVTDEGHWVSAVHTRSGKAGWGPRQNGEPESTTTMTLRTPTPRIKSSTYESRHSNHVVEYEYYGVGERDFFKDTRGNFGLDRILYTAMLREYVEEFAA